MNTSHENPLTEWQWGVDCINESSEVAALDPDGAQEISEPLTEV